MQSCSHSAQEKNFRGGHPARSESSGTLRTRLQTPPLRSVPQTWPDHRTVMWLPATQAQRTMMSGHDAVAFSSIRTHNNRNTKKEVGRRRWLFWSLDPGSSRFRRRLDNLYNRAAHHLPRFVPLRSAGCRGNATWASALFLAAAVAPQYFVTRTGGT
jgi:hypothetical protein